MKSDPARRAVVTLLRARHRTAVAVVLALASGAVGGKQYASAVSCVRERTDADFAGRGAAERFEYFDQIRRDAWRAERYLGARVDWLEALVMSGESAGLEFKATVRKNVKTGRIDQAVTGASLKTVAGFVNGEGGTLLIGVTDEGKPVENLVALDELKNEDKFLRFLFAKMGSAFGTAVSTSVTARFELLEGRSVCVVRCSRGEMPVFLRLAKNVEEFFVRNGPSTESLTMRDAVGYIRRRFPEYGG